MKRLRGLELPLLAVLALGLVIVAVFVVRVRDQRNPTRAGTQFEAGGFTSDAVVDPLHATAGSAVSIKASVVSDKAMSGVVDIEVYSPDHVKLFQQFFENQQLQGGLSQTYSATWNVPLSEPSRLDTVKIGVFTPGWAKVSHWNDNAAELSVQAANPPAGIVETANASGPVAKPAFTPNATIDGGPVVAGSQVTMQVSVGSDTTTAALIDLEVYGPAADKVFQQTFDNQALTAGQSKTLSASWKVPPSATPGSYQVKVGVFKAGWGTLYAWNDRAATLPITAAKP